MMNPMWIFFFFQVSFPPVSRRLCVINLDPPINIETPSAAYRYIQKDKTRKINQCLPF